MALLSVIVPVYNEAKTIRDILAKINALDIDKEMVVVDDGSTDGTDKILMDIKYNCLKVIHHTSNRGKGAAFLTGLTNASGEFVIIQDADLEYDPNDYQKLLTEVRENHADMVLGNRFRKEYHGLFMHKMGNRFLTWLLNALFSAKLNDYATCYKIARRQVFESLNLKATGFDIDVEVVCNALKKRLRLLEIPVCYNPRTYKEGKKIRWSDGLWAMYYIIKYRFVG
ncbi:MAG: glycosyltransferase family 2 protein [Candidatus Omnitrophica bacterium]|nr:glycosyltransferase family 2 protein [Candidatus Omnitrophota bacterium]